MSGSSAGEEALALAGPTRRRAGGEERQLVHAAQHGSADALETLVRRHWPGALRIAYAIVRDRDTAEDVAQESMLAAVRSLDRFDRRRRFAPWLHRIVANRALDSLRARKRRAEVELHDTHQAEFAGTDAPLSDQLTGPLGRLSAEDRAIVAMSHLFGYSAREIGQILDLKPGAVRSRLSRALARVRAEMTKSGQTDSEVPE